MSMDQLMALVPIEAAGAAERVSGRKSRWERLRPRRGKSRFGPSDERIYLPPPFIDVPPGLTPNQLDQFLREQRLEELSMKLAFGQLEDGDPDIRAPSPPPIYDRLGNRTNTRDVRVRNAMHAEHQSLIEYCISNIEGYVPPVDYRPCKKVRRIMIPQDQYPEYNFMGLIIGPRGCNHKRLEVESGAQISIRGRGTQKEGKKTDQTDEEAAMPQHVHIAADSEEKLKKAVNLIEPLLDPFHPMHEEFKKRGLEQLALVNGVQLTKSEQRCAICGATGHLAWECPDMQHQSFKKAEVKCAFCGDMGHVTMDCKIAKEQGIQPEELRAKHEEEQKKESGAPPPPPPPPESMVSGQEAWMVDEEYQKMMTELSGQAVAKQLDDIPGLCVPPPPPTQPPAQSPTGAVDNAAWGVNMFPHGMDMGMAADPAVAQQQYEYMIQQGYMMNYAHGAMLQQYPMAYWGAQMMGYGGVPASGVGEGNDTPATGATHQNGEISASSAEEAPEGQNATADSQNRPNTQAESDGSTSTGGDPSGSTTTSHTDPAMASANNSAMLYYSWYQQQLEQQQQVWNNYAAAMNGQQSAYGTAESMSMWNATWNTQPRY